MLKKLIELIRNTSATVKQNMDKDKELEITPEQEAILKTTVDVTKKDEAEKL